MVSSDLVVEVYGAGERRGSGYLIASALVLTSAHVVPEVGEAVAVSRPRGSGRGRRPYAATVVWRGTPGGRDDAALVRIGDGGEGAGMAGAPVEPVRWGRLVTHQPETPCETVGLPCAGQDDLLHETGTVNRADRSANNRYLMRLKEPVDPCVDASGRTVSPWAGLSGAPMFCGGLLTGVVATDFGGFRHTRLEVAPAYVLLRNKEFRRILVGHSLGTALEPVEWQKLSGFTPEGRERFGWHDGPAPAKSPAALLEADRAVVPFHGRDGLVEDLLGWCREPGLGVRLLHGPGGQGKTRLALELTKRLESGSPAPEGGGFTVVWLAGEATAEEMATLADAAVPVLVVVDYAETRVGQLTTLLKRVVGRRSPVPFRVLLLARTADDWWRPVRRVNSDMRDLLEDMQQTPLPALAPEPGDRAGAYRAAVESFARALALVPREGHRDWGKLAKAVTGAAGDRLEAPGLDMALTLHMTALADLLDASLAPKAGTDAADRRAGQVEGRLLDHESKYWHSAATQYALPGRVDEETWNDALAAAFLCGAEDLSQGEDLLSRISTMRGKDAECHHAVAGWICSLYPPRDGQAWGALRPDRLAEYFVGERLLGNRRLADDLLGGTTPGGSTSDSLTWAQRVQLLTVHTRAAAHPARRGMLDAQLTTLCVRRQDLLVPPAVEVATQVERPAPLVSALRLVADAPGATHDELLRLADRLPRPTHTLGPLAVHVAERLVEVHRRRADEDPAARPGLALMLRRLSGRLGDMDRIQEAYEAASEAAHLYERLAKDDPATYQPHHAAVLHNLSVMAARSGRRKEALEPAKQSVRIYRRLVRGLPDTDESQNFLAHGLSALARAEGDLGNAQAAVEAIDKAVRIRRRRLAGAHDDEARADLATALNDQAVWGKEYGQIKKALKASEEAVSLYRQLADRRPDAFRTGLAQSLSTRSDCLGVAGRPKDALTAAQEALAIRRRLADERPDSYLADLALSLNTLAIDLADTGRPAEALPYAAEAVTVYRSLADREPSAYEHELANSLNTYAHKLHDTGQLPEAAAAAQEAVTRYRALATSEPDLFTADLAMSLMTLSSQFSAAGQTRKARETIEESVRLHRILTTRRPGAFEHELASSLNNLCLALNHEDRPQEALAAVDEAIGLHRRAVAGPAADRARPALATALLNKVSCLTGTGRLEEAVPVAAQAVRLFRDLARREPDIHEPRYAAALSGYWAVLHRAGHTAKALRTLEKSVTVRERLLKREDTTAHRRHYVEELSTLGYQLSAAGRTDEAAEALKKAVAIRRGLRDEDPDSTTREFALSLSLLATNLVQAGRRPEALPVAEEAARVLSDLVRQDDTYRAMLTESLCLLGGLLHNAGRPGAEEVLQRAVRLSDALPPANPHDTLRSFSRCLLGTHLVESGRTADGLPHARHAAAIARDLAGTDPVHGQLLAWTLLALGRLLALDSRTRADALDVCEEAVLVCEELQGADPVARETVLAGALAQHGLRLAETARYQEAMDATARAVALSRELAGRHGAAHQEHLAFSLYAHARTRLLANTDLEEAVLTITEALPIWQMFADNEPGLVAPYLATVTATYARLVGREPAAR